MKVSSGQLAGEGYPQLAGGVGGLKKTYMSTAEKLENMDKKKQDKTPLPSITMSCICCAHTHICTNLGSIALSKNKYILSFGITLDLQESCKDSFYLPFTQFPLMLTPYITEAYLSKLRN